MKKKWTTRILTLLFVGGMVTALTSCWDFWYDDGPYYHRPGPRPHPHPHCYHRHGPNVDASVNTANFTATAPQQTNK